jgi:hypothetical protein
VHASRPASCPSGRRQPGRNYGRGAGSIVRLMTAPHVPVVAVQRHSGGDRRAEPSAAGVVVEALRGPGPPHRRPGRRNRRRHAAWALSERTRSSRLRSNRRDHRRERMTPNLSFFGVCVDVLSLTPDFCRVPGSEHDVDIRVRPSDRNAVTRPIRSYNASRLIGNDHLAEYNARLFPSGFGVK